MNVKNVSFYLCLSASLLTACGTPSATSSSTTTENNKNIVAAAQPDQQAIQKYDQLFSLTPTEQDAKQHAIQKCMATKGFVYFPASAQTRSVRNIFMPELTLEQARANGYTQESTEQTTSPGENTPGYQEALIGTPGKEKTISVQGVPGGIASDGCLASAYKDLFGTAETGIFFEGGSLNFPIPYVNATLEDPRIGNLAQQWSDCMKNDHNLIFKTPDEARSTTGGNSQEIAVADAQCREKTNFEPQLRSIFSQYLTSFFNDHQDLVQKLTEAKKTAQENAPKILAS